MVDGHACLAPVVARGDWGGASDVDTTLSAAEGKRIAQLWLDDALMEHASIAAFARFTQQLLVLGAPAELLAEAARATADEVRHAELCFALAARYGLARRGPGALPEALGDVSSDPVEIAVATFVEGCIGETVAAHLAALQGEQALDPAARDALRRIAPDEARHSELAWRFVQWIARRHAEVLPALRDELAHALAAMPGRAVEHESASTLAALHAAGRLSAHEQLCAHAAVLRDVVAPCLAALDGDCCASHVQKQAPCRLPAASSQSTALISSAPPAIKSGPQRSSPSR